jgi:TRAP-type C4-dicarboxylate transport system permease small subunit
VLKKFYDNFEEAFCVICMGTMVICLSLQFLIRLTTGSSLAWTEELSRFTFIWTVYIGVAVVAKHNGHVRVTAQFLLAPLKVQLAMRLLADCIWAGFTLFIAWQSWKMVQLSLEYPETSPTLGIVKAYVEMIVPLGFLIVVWRIMELWFRRLRAGTLYSLVQDSEAGCYGTFHHYHCYWQHVRAVPSRSASFQQRGHLGLHRPGVRRRFAHVGHSQFPV